MFITSQQEIESLMPTARWDRPFQLFGYLEEEERSALEPLLGTELYDFLCNEYVRLKSTYGDITSISITSTRKICESPQDYDDVTAQLDAIQAQEDTHQHDSDSSSSEDSQEIPSSDYRTVCLIRICQQIEFYRMLAHKSGLLTVSFNDGGGMNMVSADGYEPADDKRMERVVKDAYMSAGRSTDSLLLFLEADAKGQKQFTEKWKHAVAFYIQKDLLFQTARVLNKYLDIKSERMTYISLVHDIRFCQYTYLRPRIGSKLLAEVIRYVNDGMPDGTSANTKDAMDELSVLLRIALAFYVEGRRTTIGPKQEKFARRDSMADAQQAMAAACQFIEEHLDDLGESVTDSPIYKKAEKERKEQECVSRARNRRAANTSPSACGNLFTAFPATHRNPELK